jgi:predicted secreted protein
MKKILVLSTCLALVALAACAPSTPTPLPLPPPAPPVTDPTQSLATDAGQEFQIVIESNPTTGYHWEIEGNLDESIVQFVSNDYRSTSAPGLVGGGGVDMWTFKALKEGTTQITLGYHPPSNDPLPAERTVTFTVNVK